MPTATQRRLRLPLAIAAATTVFGAVVALPAAGAQTPPTSTTPSPIALLTLANYQLGVEVAAGHGHIVAMRGRAEGGSELVELVAGQEPRRIRRFGGEVATPTVGADAQGHPIVVLSPCLEFDASGRPLAPHCSLQVVRVDDGSTKVLPRSAGAYIGVLDGRAAGMAGARAGGLRRSQRHPARLSCPISYCDRSPGLLRRRRP